MVCLSLRLPLLPRDHLSYLVIGDMKSITPGQALFLRPSRTATILIRPVYMKTMRRGFGHYPLIIVFAVNILSTILFRSSTEAHQIFIFACFKNLLLLREDTHCQIILLLIYPSTSARQLVDQREISLRDECIAMMLLGIRGLMLRIVVEQQLRDLDGDSRDEVKKAEEIEEGHRIIGDSREVIALTRDCCV
ncbi:hypothetical protein Tco_0816726 [Tanacetum coccineum]